MIKSNPQDGTIKIVFNPTREVSVGDSFQIKASLSSPGKEFDQIFLVKISEKDKTKEKVKKPEQDDQNKIGLPELVLVYKDEKEGEKRETWEKLSEVGIQMDFPNILHPFVEGDILQRIYVNMDSNVLKNYKTNLKSEEQFNLADKKYFSSVYFHTLFLFTISKNKKYSMRQLVGNVEEDRDIVDYIKDVFESHYSSFLLNFGMEQLMGTLEQ